jgi:tRNA modification GTPase
VYNFNDTIAAVSSPSNDHRIILRLTGPQTIVIINQIFTPASPAKRGEPAVSGNPGIASGRILNLDSVVYLFRQPHSYTGDDLAEIHLWANQAITEALMERLLVLGARPAAPGEFTARAYLNNKINLAQAEAVNEVITASNTFQLAAAENLLAGQFGHTREKISSTILDLLSRLEADLDFSTEDIIPQNSADIIKTLNETATQLKGLLSGSVRCESTLDLPAVGIAGAPNAGKSTLLNKLLGRQRSIVSEKRKTTRDVLTGELTIHDCRCILFDCAGLTTHAETILDELAQQAAIEALRNAMVVIFCVDIAKPDWTEDLAIRRLINPAHLIAIATKTDLLAQPDKVCHSERSEESLISANQPLRAVYPERSEWAQGDTSEVISKRISRLKSLFGCDFLPVSAKTGEGLQELKQLIGRKIIEISIGPGINGTSHESRVTGHGVALTARHKQTVTSAIADLEKAIDELKAGNDEVAAMMLRTAYHSLEGIDQHNIDEQLLDRIFSRFCIGK